MFKRNINIIIVIFLLFPLGLFAENVFCRIEPAEEFQSKDGKFFVGDTIRFKISINDNSTKFTGFRYYLTVNPKYLEPVLDNNKKPFTPAWLLSKNNSSIVDNNLHGDEIGSPNKNEIDGYQLDFLQQANATNGGERPYVTASGAVAYFKLAIKQVPQNDSDYLIKFNSNNFTHRITGYYNQENPGVTQEYAGTSIFDFTIIGGYIYPKIADTLVAPGTTLTKDLDEYFINKKYDDSVSIWQYERLMDEPFGNMSISAEDVFNFSTEENDFGIARTKLTVQIDGEDINDSQKWEIRVDNPPKFIMDEINFDEDEEYKIARNTLVSDPDVDRGVDYLKLNKDTSAVKDSIIGFNYLPEEDSIVFSPEKNWNGSKSITLKAQDSLVHSPILKELQVNVQSVNDLPRIDLKKIGGDTIPLYYYLEKTLDLNTFIKEIDKNDEIVNKTVSLFGDSTDMIDKKPENVEDTVIFKVSKKAIDNNFTGTIPVEISAEDSKGAIKSDTLVIDVLEKKMPAIEKIPIQRIGKDTTAKLVELNKYVYTKNVDSLQWIIGDTDNLKYIFDPKIVEKSVFQVSSGSQYGLDSVQVIVENPAGRRDSTYIKIGVAPSGPAPYIFNLPDTSLVEEDEIRYVDLEKYVFDLKTPAKKINWKISYDKNYLNCTLDTNQIVTAKAFTNIGHTEVEFTAIDEDSNKSSRSAIFTIIQNNPPEWRLSEKDKNFKMSHINPSRRMDFKLTTRCKDDFTPVDKLEFKILSSQEIKKVDLDTNKTPEVFMNTNIAQSIDQGWIKFVGIDEQGKADTSDRVKVPIRESWPPQWWNLPSRINMNNKERKLFDLNNYCDDPDTDSSNLSFTKQIRGDDSLRVNILENGYVDIDPFKNTEGLIKITFIAKDEQGETSSVFTTVDVADVIPPKISMNQFFNPINPRRVNFVLTTERRAEFMDAYFYRNNSFIKKLNFEQKDKNVWEASYNFKRNGEYSLRSQLKDKSERSNVSRDTLLMNVNIPDSTAGQFSLGSDIQVSYNKVENYHKQIFMVKEIEEDTLKNNALNKKTKSSKVYQVRTGLKSNNTDLMIKKEKTARFNQYYGFYQIQNGKYIYKDTFIDRQGDFAAEIKTGEKVTFMKADRKANRAEIPRNTFLAYPNPFNSTVKFKFMMKQRGQVQLQVYNILGQKVFSKTRKFSPGYKKLNWNAVTNEGRKVSSGVYIILLKRNGQKLETKKISYIK